MILAMTMTLMRQGAIAVNRPREKQLASDKVLSLIHLASAGIRVPPTIYSASKTEIDQSAAKLGHPSVIKLTEGLWGAGVMRVDSETSMRTVSEAFLQLGHPVLAQPYLLRGAAKQYRVLVLGEQVLSAHETEPAVGDFRANLHAGASSHVVDVSDDLASVSVASAKALGLDFAGVDLIVDDDGPCVIEVNPAPGFAFSRDLPQVEIADQLVDFIEQSIQRRQ